MQMSYEEKWYSITTSDEEKNCNLDGPYDWVNYWQDLTKLRNTRIFCRVQSGGSVIVWAVFSFNGQTSHLGPFSMDKHTYCRCKKFRRDWVYEQDNVQLQRLWCKGELQ